jgi:hypothetical protein
MMVELLEELQEDQQEVEVEQDQLEEMVNCLI